jgi:hypothetical protein
MMARLWMLLGLVVLAIKSPAPEGTAPQNAHYCADEALVHANGEWGHFLRLNHLNVK